MGGESKDLFNTFFFSLVLGVPEPQGFLRRI